MADAALVQQANDLSAAGYGPYLQDLMSNQGYDLAAAVLQTQTKQALDTIKQLAQAVKTAERAGQADAAAGLRVQLQYWVGQIGALNRQANAGDRPSALMQALSTFSDDAINTAKQAGVDVDALVKQLQTLLKALPLLVWVAVAGVLVFYLVPFFKRRS